LIGIPVAIGLLYLFNDLKRLKNENVAPEPLAQPIVDGLEAVGYIDPLHFDGAVVETIEAGVEAGVETVVEVTEAVGETVGKTVGETVSGFIEAVGHGVGHLLHH
jgi:hypothetical protein